MLTLLFRREGRLSRFDFITRGSLLVVANLVVFFLVLALIASQSRDEPSALGFVGLAVLLAQMYVYVVGSTSLAVRRLRDAGRPPWLALLQVAILLCAFAIGWYALIAWFVAFVWLSTEPSTPQ